MHTSHTFPLPVSASLATADSTTPTVTTAMLPVTECPGKTVSFSTTASGTPNEATRPNVQVREMPKVLFQAWSH